MTAKEAMAIRRADDLGHLEFKFKDLQACIDNALEKQIPQKAYNVKTVPNDNYINYGDCPCCNADVFEYQHYCMDCGQALDWSDEE